MAERKENHLPEETDGDFTVRQHKAAYRIGILTMGMAVFILILEIIYHLSPIALWIYAVILAIFLLGILICMEAKNRRLAVRTGSLYYCNMFGKIKRFEAEDIRSVKAVSNPAGETDYLLYDKEGKKICRLEAGMQNADRMLWYLRDNGIDIRTGRGAGQALEEFLSQEMISEENLQVLSQNVYEQASEQIEKWQGKNRKLGAELAYGFAEYYGSRIDPDAQIQAEESRIPRDRIKLPEDYMCVLEVYVQKDGMQVMDRKGGLLCMTFPVFYKRKTMTAEGEIRFYYNKNWKTDLESVLKDLEKYLPGHKFVLESMESGHELRKNVSI